MNEATEQLNTDGIAIRCEGICLSFGGVKALVDLSLEIKKGELLAIIGPNGAGKTAWLNCVSGYYRPYKGDIWYAGHRLNGMKTHAITKLGIARTYQNIRLFIGLTTLDNLMLGRHLFFKNNALDAAIYYGKTYKEESKQRQIVEQVIDFLEIGPIRKKVVATLPYGMRKRVELGRALALEPKVLLLDEVMAGMNVEEKEDMARFILDVSEDFGTTIILVEHDMGVVMSLADRIVVFDFGRKIAEGTPNDIIVNPQVISAYLGSEY